MDKSLFSSLEILIIDRAHTIYMQNWKPLLDVMSNLNKFPTTTNNDVFEVRDYFKEN